ncbi:MAG: arginine repressor [Actinomycetia bacterium]|nr:arginine repressor [Actinomycetes bacterium]MCH9841207.1 arginine repressor [Actinomycetes bacterium]
MQHIKRNPQTVSSRRSLISELVSDHQVTSQQDLLELLRKRGFVVTQATLSRDLEALGAIKRNSENEPIPHYVVPIETNTALRSDGAQAALVRSLHELLLSAEHSQVMVVVHTPPGGAQFLAGHLDRSGRFDTLGTVAGDDTIFLVARSEDHAETICNDLVALAESGT